MCNRILLPFDSILLFALLLRYRTIIIPNSVALDVGAGFFLAFKKGK